MAHYNEVYLWYRGRLIASTLRYFCYEQWNRIVRGKPLEFTEKDHAKIERLIDQKRSVQRQNEAFGDALSQMH